MVLEEQKDPDEKVGAIFRMFDQLQCVSCYQLPNDKVWMSGKCCHKYCKRCLEKLSSKECIICQEPINIREREIDLFSTELVMHLLELQRSVAPDSLYQPQKRESRNGKAIETLGKDSNIVDRSDEENNTESVTSKNEKIAKRSQKQGTPTVKFASEISLSRITPTKNVARKSVVNSSEKITSGDMLIQMFASSDEEDELPRLTPYPKADLEIRKENVAAMTPVKPVLSPKVQVVLEPLQSPLTRGGTVNISRRRSLEHEFHEKEIETQPVVDSGGRKFKKIKASLNRSTSNTYKKTDVSPERVPISRNGSTSLSENRIDESNRVGRSRVGKHVTPSKKISMKKNTDTGNKTVDSNLDVSMPKRDQLLYADLCYDELPSPENHSRKRRKASPIARSSNRHDYVSRTETSLNTKTSLNSLHDSDDDGHDFAKPKTRKDRACSIASSSFSDTSFTKVSPGARAVHKRDHRGETPLHRAARLGKIPQVKDLLAAGADVDATDHAGWAPVHDAINAKEPSLELIRILVEADCDVNALGMEKSTPLHEASRLGLREIAKYLLKQKACVTLRNSSGKLPKDIAPDKAMRKIFDDHEKKMNHTSQSSEIAVKFKKSLHEGVFYFAYDIPKDELKRAKASLKMNVSVEHSNKVTHVLFDAIPNTKISLHFDYLLAVLRGNWILSARWLKESMDVSRFLDPTKYQLAGCMYGNIPSISTCNSDALMRARENQELGNPGLFQGINFYIYLNTSWSSHCDAVNTSICLTKKELAKLIKSGDGVVSNREPNPEMVDILDNPTRFHAQPDGTKSEHKLAYTSHIILYDERNVPPKKYDFDHVKTLNVDWLIHSTVHFRLLLPDSYL